VEAAVLSIARLIIRPALRALYAWQGATYTLESIGSNGLLAGVNNKLQLYEWQPSAAGSTPSLRLRAEHCGHILVLYVAVRGDFLLVGDLMKSLSLYRCDLVAGTIEELAVCPHPRRSHAHDAHWTASFAQLTACPSLPLPRIRS
jgi:hypothetical protein